MAHASRDELVLPLEFLTGAGYLVEEKKRVVPRKVVTQAMLGGQVANLTATTPHMVSMTLEVRRFDWLLGRTPCWKQLDHFYLFLGICGAIVESDLFDDVTAGCVAFKDN